MADCPANVVSLVDLMEEEVWNLNSSLRPLSWLLRTQDDDVEMLRRAREDPLFLDAPSVLHYTFIYCLRYSAISSTADILLGCFWLQLSPRLAMETAGCPG